MFFISSDHYKKLKLKLEKNTITGNWLAILPFRTKNKKSNNRFSPFTTSASLISFSETKKKVKKFLLYSKPISLFAVRSGDAYFSGSRLLDSL